MARLRLPIGAQPAIRTAASAARTTERQTLELLRTIVIWASLADAFRLSFAGRDHNPNLADEVPVRNACKWQFDSKRGLGFIRDICQCGFYVVVCDSLS
jgi:hypothetical protein